MTALNPSAEQRYRLLNDDDGHRYFIPVGSESTFRAWVDSSYENVGYEGPDFSENRIDGRFSFTDPRCE